MNHTETVLKAAAAAAASRRSPSPPPRVDEAQVDLILARLPEKAREGRSDPEAEAFSLGTWDVRRPEHVALWAVVADRLEELGLGTLRRRQMLDVREVPCELFVTYESLEEASSHVLEGRARHLEAARAGWAARFGEGAAVAVEPGHFGHVLTFLAPELDPEDAAWFIEPGRPPARPSWSSTTDFYDHEPAELVARALHELKIPRWSFDQVAKLWAEGTGGDVERSRGLWTPDGPRRIAVLVFRLNGADKAYAVEDVYTLSAEQLVDEVLRDGIWATAAEDVAPEEGGAGEEGSEAPPDAPVAAPGADSPPPKTSAGPKPSGPKPRAHGDRR